LIRNTRCFDHCMDTLRWLQALHVVIYLTEPSNSLPQHIVTCHLRSQPTEWFIAGHQLRKYATVLETLLGSRPRVTMEVLLEEVFSMWSVPRSYLEDTWGYSGYKTRFCAPLEIFQGAHQSAICTQLLTFHMYMII
jgi:hypothetical protein